MADAFGKCISTHCLAMTPDASNKATRLRQNRQDNQQMLMDTINRCKAYHDKSVVA